MPFHYRTLQILLSNHHVSTFAHTNVPFCSIWASRIYPSRHSFDDRHDVNRAASLLGDYDFQQSMGSHGVNWEGSTKSQQHYSHRRSVVSITTTVHKAFWGRVPGRGFSVLLALYAYCEDTSLIRGLLVLFLLLLAWVYWNGTKALLEAQWDTPLYAVIGRSPFDFSGIPSQPMVMASVLLILAVGLVWVGTK